MTVYKKKLTVTDGDPLQWMCKNKEKVYKNVSFSQNGNDVYICRDNGEGSCFEQAYMIKSRLHIHGGGMSCVAIPYQQSEIYSYDVRF